MIKQMKENDRKWHANRIKIIGKQNFKTSGVTVLIIVYNSRYIKCKKSYFINKSQTITKQ